MFQSLTFGFYICQRPQEQALEQSDPSCSGGQVSVQAQEGQNQLLSQDTENGNVSSRKKMKKQEIIGQSSQKYSNRSYFSTAS